jgi:crossover junction endodeoxyribonuclease RusA
MNVTFPWPPSVLSPNVRAHWSKKSKAAKSLRRVCHLLTLEAGIRGVPWDGDIHLFVDYYPPDRRARDQDNMIAASKALFDGLADALSVNDKRFRLHPYVKEEIGGMVKVKICEGPTA